MTDSSGDAVDLQPTRSAEIVACIMQGLDEKKAGGPFRPTRRWPNSTVSSRRQQKVHSSRIGQNEIHMHRVIRKLHEAFAAFDQACGDQCGDVAVDRLDVAFHAPGDLAD